MEFGWLAILVALCSVEVLVVFSKGAWTCFGCLKGRTVHWSGAFGVDYCLCQVLGSGDFDRLILLAYSNGLIDDID